MPLEKLIKGFRKFRSFYFEKNDHYDDLVRNGQSPETLVIACSDSRNDPALLTQSEPGDIFVVRNVAAIVPPYQPDDNYHGTSAAIEFAIKGLKIKDIVVLGHSLCSGVQALSDQADKTAPDFEFLSQWIRIGTPACETVRRLLPDAPPGVKIKAMEQAVILTSLNNLMTFPWIRKGVESGQIGLHGWYFDMVNGELLDYNFTTGQFTKIQNKPHGFSKCAHQDGKCSATWPLEKLIANHS